MKKLYAIYNDDFDIIRCEFFDEVENPENSTDKLPNGQLKPKYDPVNDVIYDEATEEEISNSNIKNQIDKEFEAYEKRCLDGRIAYNKINAEFRVMKENGQIEQGYYDLISETLIPVRNEVLAGQWITALSKLENIGNSIIGIDLYNRLHTQLSNYINENY